MNEYTTKLGEALKKDQEFYDAICKIVKLYPSLREHKARWRNYLSAKEINAEADSVEFRYSCGCCADSPLLALPFKIIEGQKIYSDPPEFYIGEKNEWGSGDLPSKEWRKTIEEAGVSRYIIPKIEDYFEANKPTDYDDED